MLSQHLVYILVMKMITKSYSELMSFASFGERLEYLMLESNVAEATFGDARYINQQFYKSSLWRQTADSILLRDGGCDLAIDDFPIDRYALVHHINPITLDDIINMTSKVLDPENLITCSSQTHRIIHYGDRQLYVPQLIVRSKNDTAPWKIGR